MRLSKWYPYSEESGRRERWFRERAIVSSCLRLFLFILRSHAQLRPPTDRLSFVHKQNYDSLLVVLIPMTMMMMISIVLQPYGIPTKNILIVIIVFHCDHQKSRMDFVIVIVATTNKPARTHNASLDGRKREKKSHIWWQITKAPHQRFVHPKEKSENSLFVCCFPGKNTCTRCVECIQVATNAYSHIYIFYIWIWVKWWWYYYYNIII